MSYLNDVYYTDPNKGQLYKVTNDAQVTGFPVVTDKGPIALCVDMNMVDVWVANSTAGTISQFNNGNRVRDIRVGRSPMGICQAYDGSIYVSNFASNTVSKIANNVKIMDINVGYGPRGICCDMDNNIYVANYIDSTVTKITNGIKVDTIKVGMSPYGICCDKSDNIWVTSASNNIVSKITKDVKVMDIAVGKVPYGICCDKNGAIWVSNYFSGTVSKIVGTKVTAEIFTGDRPFAISANQDGSIYVMNFQSSTISKIYGDKKIADIPTCANPSGFGDFTGYQTYYLYKASSGSSGGLTGKVGLNDLSDDLKNLITASSGVTLPIDDLNVSHSDKTYTTVKAALDYLLYKAPVINSFTNNINQVEIGSTISSVTLNWSLNKTMVSGIIDNGIGDVSTVTTKTVTGLAITKDTTYTLTVTDDKPASVSKTTSIKFLHKVYYGANSNTALNNADILAMGSNLATGTTMSHTFNCTGGKYIYIVMPSSFGLTKNSFSVGGLSNTDWTVTTINFTNASGYAASYDIYRSNNIQNGSAIKVDVA